MSVTGTIAIRACEQVEKSGGPRAGLVAWRTLAQNASEADVRARALGSAIRCGIALRDADALEEVIALWIGIPAGSDAGASAPALVRELARAGLTALAVDLAQSEATRHRTAHALYTYARALDVAKDAGAVAWFGTAIAHAEKEGSRGIAVAARARLMALHARAWETLPEALAIGTTLDPKQVPDAIDLARVLLFSGSRFVRAGAIGVLTDVQKSDDVTVRLRARRLAARYADEAGEAVTPLEQDRLNALIKDALASNGAKETNERARDLVRGRYEVPRDDLRAVPSDPRARRLTRHEELLDAVVAMRDRSPARAARVLRALAANAARPERLPREAFAVAHAALVAGDPELRDVAVELVGSLLDRPSYAAPPRGFLALADALGEAEQPALALRARRAAALRKETNAVQSLAVVLTRVGWEAARGDDRAHAIELLREAKALILGSG